LTTFSAGGDGGRRSAVGLSQLRSPAIVSELFRIVVGDDKNRQRPRAHQHLTSASPDFPVGHLLTMCEKQKARNSRQADFQKVWTYGESAYPPSKLDLRIG
jgi:hypothetical protein